MKTGLRLGIVLRWWWVLLAGAVLGAGAALIAVGATSPVYRATSTLFVISPSDPSLNQSFARTYAQMAVDPSVLQWVREIMELPISVTRLEGMISARPIPETHLVEIVVQAGDPALARDIANAVAQAFVEQQGAQMPVGPAGPSLRIGQPAVTPDQPIGPRSFPAIALGVLVGVLLGLGLAGLLDAPRPMPAPLTAPTRQPTRAPVRAAAAAPSVDERIGESDVLRGVLVLAMAVTVLVVPLAAIDGLRKGLGGASSAPSQQPIAAAPIPPQVAAVPGQQQVVPQAQSAAAFPLADVVPLPGGEPTSGGTAEIAGATSAAPPGGGAATPSDAAAPRAAPPAAAVAAAASPAGAVGRAPSFEARFDGSQQAWPDDQAGPARFQDGAYRVTAQVQGQFVGISAPFTQPLRDVAVTASFRKVGGPPGGVYGVILRDAGPPPRDGYNQVGNFYVLGVDDRGQYAVWRQDGDRWVDLVPLTPSDAVRGGTEPNEINARAVDERLTLTVNGVEVATVLGVPPRPGTAGIFVDGDSNVVLVSRFQIEAVTTSAESTSLPAGVAESTAAERIEVAGAVDSRSAESRSATTQAPAGFTSALLREAPATSSRALASLPNGTPLEILPETASGDGFTWLRARTEDGLLGWIVSTAVAD